MTSLTNLPLEVVASINGHLDLKSSIHFGVVAKLFVNPVIEGIAGKEQRTIKKILQRVSQQIKYMHRQLTSDSSKAEVLANLLRRLIWTTTTVEEEPPDALAGIQHQCVQEHNNLFLYVSEEMDISWAMYNTLMENAQFEYRGFRIIGLPPQVRTDLDNFKQLVERRYYDDIYKIQVYIGFTDDTYLEMIYDGVQLTCDVHARINEQWTFITDVVTNNEQYLDLQDSMVVVDPNHEDEAFDELCRLIMTHIRPSISSNLFRGAQHVNLAVWNAIYEENIVFASTIDKWMHKFYAEDVILNHTRLASDEYHNDDIPWA